MPSSLTCTLSLSGLKSLVTIVPGSMTRVGCGSSALQNVLRRVEKKTSATLRLRTRGNYALRRRLTVSVDGPSQSVFPTSLLAHSCVLSCASLTALLAVTPGTTSGMLDANGGGRLCTALLLCRWMTWRAVRMPLEASGSCWCEVVISHLGMT